MAECSRCGSPDGVFDETCPACAVARLVLVVLLSGLLARWRAIRSKEAYDAAEGDEDEPTTAL